jgi:hypothetical protein
MDAIVYCCSQRLEQPLEQDFEALATPPKEGRVGDKGRSSPRIQGNSEMESGKQGAERYVDSQADH